MFTRDGLVPPARRDESYSGWGQRHHTEGQVFVRLAETSTATGLLRASTSWAASTSERHKGVDLGKGKCGLGGKWGEWDRRCPRSLRGRGVDTCLIRSTPFETHVGGLLHRHPAPEPTGPATPSVPPASSKLPSPEIHSSAVAQGNARAPSPTPGRCSHPSAPPVCARKADPQARWPSTGCGQRLLRFVRSFTDETDPRLLFL